MGKPSFLGVILDLERQKKSGVLKLKQDQLEKSIYFKQGKIIFIDSSIRSENLGRILVDSKRITEEQFEKVVNRVKESGKRQGEVLVELGFLTPYEVFEALKDQLVKKLLNCFILRDFTHNFEEGEDKLQKITEIPINVHRTIIDGVQSSYSHEILKEEVTFTRQMAPLMSATSQGIVNQIGLRPDELKLTRMFDGKKALFDIVKDSELDHQFILSTVYVLHELGVVEYKTALPKRVPIKPKEEPEIKDDSSSEQIQEQAKKEQPEADEKAPSVPTEAKSNEPKKDSPLYGVYIKLDTQGYLELFGLSVKFKKDDLRKNYEGFIKKFSLDKIDQTYAGQEKEMAEKIFNKVVTAFTVLKDDKKKDAYLKTRASTQQVKPPGEEDKVLQAEIEATKAALYRKKNDINKAAHAYKRAIDLNPQEIEYHVNFAELLMTLATEKKTEIPKMVEETLKKALSIDQNNFNVILNLGIYYKLTGDRQKALAYFHKTVEINPRNPRANAELRLLNIRGEKKSLFSFFAKKPKKGDAPKRAAEEDEEEGENEDEQ